MLHLMDKSKGLPEETFESGAATRKKGKFIHGREELKVAVMAIPSNKRRKTRHLAAVLDLPRSTVDCLPKQEKFFKHHTSAVKPKLTTANKHLRILHALEHINPQTINSQTQSMKCLHMENEVHFDEKWFFVCRDGESYVLVSDETPPERAVEHKSHIAKVMFLFAQARPRKLTNNTWWDGKIGIILANWMPQTGRTRQCQQTKRNSVV